MKTIEFDYNLPEELIASYPSKDRTKSRLLIDANPEEHRIFSEIDKFINKDDLLILNNTSVLPARLFGKKKPVERLKFFSRELLARRQRLFKFALQDLQSPARL